MRRPLPGDRILAQRQRCELVPGHRRFVDEGSERGVRAGQRDARGLESLQLGNRLVGYGPRFGIAFEQRGNAGDIGDRRGFARHEITHRNVLGLVLVECPHSSVGRLEAEQGLRRECLVAVVGNRGEGQAFERRYSVHENRRRRRRRRKFDRFSVATTSVRRLIRREVKKHQVVRLLRHPRTRRPRYHVRIDGLDAVDGRARLGIASLRFELGVQGLELLQCLAFPVFPL